MQVSTTIADPVTVDCDAFVVVAHKGNPLGGTAETLDLQLKGILSRFHEQEVISTEIGKVTLLHGPAGLKAKCLAIVGGGDAANFDSGQAFQVAGAAAKRLAERQLSKIVFDIGKQESDILAAAVAGAMNGCVGQDIFRAKKNLHAFDEIVFVSDDEAAAQHGTTLGEGVLLGRELVNLPANYIYPESFTGRAADVAVSSGFTLEVWDELRLRREGCGALLAVSAGSARPPRLLIMRYEGSGAAKPLALVGKGVTFDSGGLSLKPSESMLSMKCDMAGAATVLATMQTIARLKVATPVVGLVGLVENMVSSNSYRLGDVLTSRSGKTIEIHNTDAEGRLVLADVLSVALDQRPSHIIDLATLTGACVVALGTDVTGLMGNNEAWNQRVISAAKSAGEYVWPLPMYDFFAEQIKSAVADIKNVGDGRWGGAITAAKFLEEFVDDVPWVHLDIAGPAFSEKPKSFLDAGGTGAMIRTLTNLIRQF